MGSSKPQSDTVTPEKWNLDRNMRFRKIVPYRRKKKGIIGKSWWLTAGALEIQASGD